MSQLLGFQEIPPVAFLHKLLPGKVVVCTKLSYVPWLSNLVNGLRTRTRMEEDEPNVVNKDKKTLNGRDSTS